MVRITFLIAVLSLAFTGCGSKGSGYKVHGTLTRGGQPLRPQATDLPPAVGNRVQLTFYPLPAGPRPADPFQAGVVGFHAMVHADGTFDVPDRLPPGKYLIAVHVRPYGPLGADELEDRFSFQSSKIIEEINADRAVAIELGNYR